MGTTRLPGRWLRWLAWAFGMLLVTGCGLLPEEPVRRDAQYPKVVLQTLPTNGIELAAWTPDDRHIITAVGQMRSVAIWEVATGNIVDRLTLPAEGGQTGVLRRLRDLRVADDGRSVIIDAETTEYANNQYSPTRLQRYELDLQTKVIRQVKPPADMKPLWQNEQIEEAGKALAAIFEGRGDDSIPDPEAVLLPLPTSHDGKWALERVSTPMEFLEDGSPAEGGLAIVATDGTGERRLLTHPPMALFADAALSSDGRWFAIVNAGTVQYDGDTEPSTTFEIFDIETAEFLPQASLKGYYSAIDWLDEERVFLRQHTSVWDRNAAEPLTLSDAVVYNTQTGEEEFRFPGRCSITPAPDGSFFGSGTGNCIPVFKDEPYDIDLVRYDPAAGEWQPFGALPQDSVTVIETLALSGDGSRMVVAALFGAEDAKESGRALFLLDTATGEVLSRQNISEVGEIETIAFDAGGGRVLLSREHRMYAWSLADGAFAELPVRSLDTSIIETNADLMAVSGYSDDVVSLFDLAAGKRVVSLDYGNIVTGGFVPGKPLFWAFSNEGGIRIWDTRDWSERLTAYFFFNQGFMAVTPDGRYDSNIHPYKAQFRWLVPDEPLNSLNPDAFSRDYYSPGLAQKWLACSVAGNCATAYPALPSLTELNRTLPVVTIRSVTPLPGDPAKAEVVMEIAEGVNPDAPSGKDRSGIFDPRLLRDHRLVFDYGTGDNGGQLEIDQWRESQQLDVRDGKAVLRQVVNLPTAGPTDGEAAGEGVLVSAYAFNADRLKGETTQFRFIPPPAPARERRAFVVSIGIDHYRETRLNLSYAGADAMLMRERLGEIPDYATHHLTLATSGGVATPTGAPAGPAYVTKDMVLAVLGILAGGDRAAMLAKLSKQGVDASMLEAATPDDLVILSYSGHGWADKGGEFFIVPSEASWAEGALTPRPDSLLSSLELAGALRGIDAGEITLIIDACHSAASVQNGSFKPGPLGDPGLGQLAFDKGVRILSATQPDDVALEDSRLRQGLLTFALAREGLAPGEWEADSNADQRIDLREWLDYAVWRLPQLSEDVRAGSFGPAGAATGTRALVFFDAPGGAAAPPKPRVQKPSLFDFNITPARTVLRRAAP